jgi:hypothetical protein
MQVIVKEAGMKLPENFGLLELNHRGFVFPVLIVVE